MKASSSVLLALCLTCTSGLVAGCSGAKEQQVLLQPRTGTSDPTTDGTSPDDEDPSTGDGDATDATCTPEEEPNDDPDEANTLAPSRCGELSEDDTKDFLTFRLKPDTSSLSIRLSGRVRLRVRVDGESPVDLTPDRSEEIPFVMDADYVIEVTALNPGSGTISWRVDVVER